MAHLAIRVLLDGGDWACAHGHWGTLATIAEDLASRLPAPEADDALAVARCGTAASGRELEQATAAWCRLRARLRAGAAVTGR